MIGNLPEIEIILDREKQAKLILAELNNFIDLKNTLVTILDYIKNISGCEAVSIRLRENKDYPYYVYNGFNESFIKHENSLCKTYDGSNIVIENHDLECMCGLVISGKTPAEFSCFTKKGSFWTNNIEETLKYLSKTDFNVKTRNYCFAAGYRSIALIPIIASKITIGLIQLNDSKTDKFSHDLIEFLEMIGGQIGLAVNNSLVFEQLQKEKDQLSVIIRELERTQTQLVESEKMASLGRLVAGIAHEINTPLGIGITATTSLIKNNEKLDTLFHKGSLKKSDLEKFIESNKETSELVLRNLQRTAKLIQNFKNTSVDQISEQKRKFDIVNYIEQVISNIQPNIKFQKINFIINPQNEIIIHSYPGVFNQIFTNLIFNSCIHGFEKGRHGTIKIDLIADCGVLFIDYFDDGRGIPKENLNKIFDPFFTTNHTEGTGLGLHIIYNLITQNLKGTVSCASPQSGGTNFKIEIPVN